MAPSLEVVSTRRFFRFFLSPLVVIVSAGLLAFLWFRSLAIEPFDFDESVYRQMAEEMKRAGSWLSQPVFNGEPYNHKPPLYIGILAGFSVLADGSAQQVTSFSSRTISILFSVALAVVLHLTWRSLVGIQRADKFEQRKINDFSLSPVFFLLMSFLPTFASSAVLLDPMLVFFTSLYVCSEALRIHSAKSSKTFSLLFFVTSVFGMAGATATKGLIGLVLPAGAALLFSISLHLRSMSSGLGKFAFDVMRTGIRDFLPAWIAAAFISGIFYFYLWQTGGAAFVEEFFIKHHFGRATSAMEGHSGSVLYYLPILFIGAGYTITWLLYMCVIGSFARKVLPQSESKESATLVQRQESQVLVVRWLLCWCSFCVGFFSFLATKLPNYIWPVWPALALLAGVVGCEFKVSLNGIARNVMHWFARWFVFLFPAFLLLVGFAVMLWEPFFARWFVLKPREEAIVSSVMQHSLPLGIGFLVAGFLVLAGSLLLRRWGELGVQRGRASVLYTGGVARWLSLFQIAGCAVLMLVVVPVAEEVMTLSVQQSTAKARMFLGVGEKLATSDLYSPNVVSSHGNPVLLGIGSSEWIFTGAEYNVILTPVWNIGLCRRHGYDIAQGSEYLRVCLRAYKRTLEGPGN